MRFGTAKDIITPKKQTRVACSGPFDQNFIGIHDDIYVRCLVFDDGTRKAVLMSYDLLFHDHELNDRIAAYAKEKYNIEKSAVIVSYTHAHTAPAVRGYHPGAHDDEYEQFLLDRSKDCLDRALCAMFEGTIEYGAIEADFNVSRRGIVNGEYANAPDINYKCDKELFIIYIRDLNGDVRSVVLNYACHPVCYPAQRVISGEYPARLCQYIDMRYYGAVSMFFQSSGGDVRPKPTIDEENTGSSWPWKRLSFKELDAFAKNICNTVCEFIDSHVSVATELSIDSDEFEIEIPIDGKQLQDFQKMWTERKNKADGPERGHAYRITHGGYNKLLNSLFLRCQTLRLTNELYIAAVGGEPCYGVKCAVKRAFEGKDVCFIGYTDACAYIVDDKVLEEGGYEPNSYLEYGLKGPFKPGLDKLYTSGFEKSLTRIKG